MELISSVFVAGITFLSGEINYSTGTSCGPSASSSPKVGWFPLSSVTVLGLSIHLWTCARIFVVYLRYRQDMKARAKELIEQDRAEEQFHDFEEGQAGSIAMETQGLPPQTIVKPAAVQKKMTTRCSKLAGSEAGCEKFWRNESLTPNSDDSIRNPCSDRMVEGPAEFPSHVSQTRSHSRANLLANVLPRTTQTKLQEIDKMLIVLWKLNWRSAKLAVFGTVVTWTYSINSLIMIYQNKASVSNPEIFEAWRVCAVKHGPQNCDDIARVLFPIWRRVLIDGMRAVLGLSVALTEMTRGTYIDAMREIWRWSSWR